MDIPRCHVTRHYAVYTRSAASHVTLPTTSTSNAERCGGGGSGVDGGSYTAASSRTRTTQIGMEAGVGPRSDTPTWLRTAHPSSIRLTQFFACANRKVRARIWSFPLAAHNRACGRRRDRSFAGGRGCSALHAAGLHGGGCSGGG